MCTHHVTTSGSADQFPRKRLRVAAVATLLVALPGSVASAQRTGEPTIQLLPCEVDAECMDPLIHPGCENPLTGDNMCLERVCDADLGVCVQPHGTFGGVEFTRYFCRFGGTTENEYTIGFEEPVVGQVDYDVHCSLILPFDPALFGGTVLFEPLRVPINVGIDERPFLLNPVFGEYRDTYFSDDFFFGWGGEDRFGYFTVSWEGPYPGDFIEGWPEAPWPSRFALPPPAPGFEIMAQSVQALRSGQPAELFGPGADFAPIERLYSFGVSRQSIALRGALLWFHQNPDNADATLFDVSYVPTAGGLIFTVNESSNMMGFWLRALYPGTFGNERIINLVTEYDVIHHFGWLGRAEADGVNRFWYEMAGTGHISARAMETFIELLSLPPDWYKGATTLEWGRVLRALLVAADRWVREEVEPPPSVTLEIDPPVIPPGIPPPFWPPPFVFRDSDGNAFDGIRLPDLEVGRGTYRGVGPFPPTEEEVFAGSFLDLQCEPLPDGSVRFRNQGVYVSGFEQQAEALVAAGFLLQADADDLIAAAAQSDVKGRCDCLVDDDCPAGLFCAVNRCVQCRLDDDCWGWDLCVDNYCVAP